MSDIKINEWNTDVEKTKKFIREVQQKINDIVIKKLDEEGVCYADDPDVAPYLQKLGFNADNSHAKYAWTNAGYSKNLHS